MDLQQWPGRVIIEGVKPQIDGGRFPIKCVTGEPVDVEADVFTDGHDAVAATLLYRRVEETDWCRMPMTPLGNDRWAAAFTVQAIGRYTYAIHGQVDRFATWSRGVLAKLHDGQDVDVDLQVGVELLERVGASHEADDRAFLRTAAEGLSMVRTEGDFREWLDDHRLTDLMYFAVDLSTATTYDPGMEVVVDPTRARFSAWYELFPRSFGPEGAHGTFKDVEAQLPRIASMGFDVLYFPPIHPIGTTFRKGKNNVVTAEPDDTGSPWGIGSQEGGHKAVHPELGSLEDFRHLLQTAKGMGIDVALDIAFQCSPDHPYVKEHPEWFRKRPDGTIQYAENPPKKYQDIYPFDFESEDWRALWEELRDVFYFWVRQGVRIFRVDNPHTKPLAFWEWVIGSIKQDYPEVVFLSEAFTRPKMMYRLAKLGFTQSYTYFAWRNSKHELAEYLTELTQTEVREFFRPNFWPNTPDILTEYLQTGGRPAFEARLVLAATLTASYGIYGPAFELLETEPREPHSEEYLHSEKYQIRQWDLDRPGNLAEAISRVNAVRRENPALQSNASLRFHTTDNDQIISYSKREGDNVLLVFVNLDPHWKQSCFTHLDLGLLGVSEDRTFEVHDLLNSQRYLWRGPRNYVELDPAMSQAHIFRVHADLPTERDFDPNA